MRALQPFERPLEVAEGVAADRRVGQELPEVVEALGGAGAAKRRIGTDVVERPANERRHLVGRAAVPDQLVDRAADVDDDVIVANAETAPDGVTCRAVNVPATGAHPLARGARQHGPDHVRDLLVVVLHGSSGEGRREIVVPLTSGPIGVRASESSSLQSS
jgi:hypothetical protein